mmetsp:Transcript_16480/g.18425  ORF Transcript_16480/g.18425 Transcript_16480/m.18425 type:complete len:516 (-) Transcript_16480:727-2274(-)|eukprot:CAMPEP_0170825320 /NCGR_PEP_ID=MMETSP0733-20121128/45875_1 /TAXON_ID=186038 /ORGANISM="Fragilariopsis kerguelensis, Strain L26-C5" /LENGTH=515 /DNA_ID=CAMNT_0011188829 /DNA_START=33 /DNA_END=1580 /DNA_ORIENTATION=+
MSTIYRRSNVFGILLLTCWSLLIKGFTTRKFSPLFYRSQYSPSISSNHHTQASSYHYDATFSDKSFLELYDGNLPEWLLEKCEECKFDRPTLIQQRALDVFFKEGPNSMVVKAQTGSGKTLTYLLPLLSKLEDRSSVQAMIVVPTRELGLQVAIVAKRLVARRFMVMSLLEGSALKRQRKWAWAETPQVVIGTPTELLDMVQYGGLPRISSIRTVVVDEVDACLIHRSGASLQGSSYNSSVDTKTLSSSLHQLLSKFMSPTFADEDDIDDDDVIVISDDSNKKRKRKFRHRQTIFCSATIPQHRHFLKQCKANQWTLEEPVYVCTSPGEHLPPTLKHAYMVCKSNEKKMATLRDIIKRLNTPSNKILVFFDSSRPLNEIGKRLALRIDKGIFDEDKKTSLDDIQSKPAVSILRFEDSLSQRASATKTFSERSHFRVMVTTDLVARGLDILGVTHIIHFDLPPDADTYLHRSGRAGRLGQKGSIISILTSDQEFVLKRLANELSVNVKCVGRQKVR